MEQVYAINWFIELNHTNGSNPDQQTAIDCTLSLMAINPIPECPSQVVSCWGRYLSCALRTFHGIEHLVHHDSTLQTFHIQQGHLPALTDIIISNNGILALGFTCIYMIMDRICTVHIGARDLSLTRLCFALDTPHAYTWVYSLPVQPNNNESRSTHREEVYFWTINKTPTLTTHRAGLTNRW